MSPLLKLGFCSPLLPLPLSSHRPGLPFEHQKTEWPSHITVINEPGTTLHVLGYCKYSHSRHTTITGNDKSQRKNDENMFTVIKDSLQSIPVGTNFEFGCPVTRAFHSHLWHIWTTCHTLWCMMTEPYGPKELRYSNNN